MSVPKTAHSRGNNRARECAKKKSGSYYKMAGASGTLNMSQNLDKTAMEDPAEAWIDLVIAYREKKIEVVKMCLLIAKTSKWTEEHWDKVTMEQNENEDSEDSSYDEFPNAQDPYSGSE